MAARLRAVGRGAWLVAALCSTGGSLLAQRVEWDAGGRLREQFEFFRNREFGEVEPTRDAYLLHRLQLRGEMRVGDELAALVELVNALAIEQDTPLAPIDEDRLDVLRAQVDWMPETAFVPDLRIRAGRQELMLGRGRLLSSREGPNVRLAFDGLRASFGDREETGLRVDAFALAPVDLERGVFDDGTVDDELLFGSQLALDWWRPSDSDADGDSLVSEFYYLGRVRDDAALANVRGDEERHTVGTRLAGNLGPVGLDLEGMVQFGRIGDQQIRAFAASAIVDYEFEDLPWRPRPGVRLDVISGDRRAGDGASNTFDALYPNNSYFNEAAAFAPSNLYSIVPQLGFQPHADVRVDVMWDFAWRFSTADSVYVPPGLPLFDPEDTGARFIGHSFTLASEWEIAEDLAFSAAVTHIEAGRAITDPGGRDVTYVAAWLNWWF